MGASGNGKTTLLNTISTIDSVTSGNIIINGVDITNLKEEELSNFRKKNLGFVFQDFNLLDTLTIKEKFNFILVNKSIPLSLSYLENSLKVKLCEYISKRVGVLPT